MYFVFFYMNSRERSCRAEVLTCTASDTSLLVHYRNSWRSRIVWILSYHADGSDRAVSCTVAAAYAILIDNAVVEANDCMAYLYR